MPSFLSRCTPLLSSLLACGIAQAQSAAPDFLADFVWPRNGASSADDVYALYADNCGRPHPDPQRPATHALDAATRTLTVDIYLQEPATTICPAVVQFDTLHAVSLGKLARGTYTVVRRLHVRAAAGGEHRLTLETTDGIVVGDTPNPAVSGTWFDPRTAGSGLFVNLMASEDPNVPSGEALIFVLTQRGSGAPVWLGGTGRFVDATLVAGLQPAGATDGTAPAATATFRYLGCGSARLSLEGDTDVLFPSGDAAIMQLTATGGLPGCTPPVQRPPSMP